MSENMVLVWYMSKSMVPVIKHEIAKNEIDLALIIKHGIYALHIRRGMNISLVLFVGAVF